MLSTVGESGQPCHTPLLTFIGCVYEVSSLIFILLFSCIFIIALRNGWGIFLSCTIPNSNSLHTSSKAFSQSK
jgi:hypothetical protein